ncbi:lysophospholipid acyltransferase family protein [Novimethylophilus kurashikiensis]|nr:lysophospholipid acyltransferase family protein [Novimethylophilus kurashikiensis]
MLTWLLRLFARLPLPLIHFLGIVLGWSIYLISPQYASRLRNHLKASGISQDKAELRRILRKNIGESGKAMVETFAIWFRPYLSVLDWVRQCNGWDDVETALAQGRGIIFLTPHLGCFEITSLLYASRHPIGILYRPPRKVTLEPLIIAGRQRGQVTLAPTNLKGVRTLLQFLKKGHAVGILPDQVPSTGEGEWAPFLGRPAYTMTLVNRLAASTDAVVVTAFGERLPWGRGYIVHFEVQPEGTASTSERMNGAIEDLIRRKPDQYLWSYPRWKVPRGAPKPPAAVS